MLRPAEEKGTVTCWSKGMRPHPRVTGSGAPKPLLLGGQSKSGFHLRYMWKWSRHPTLGVMVSPVQHESFADGTCNLCVQNRDLGLGQTASMLAAVLAVSTQLCTTPVAIPCWPSPCPPTLPSLPARLLTRPLSTISRCRSLDARTSTCIACIRPVQEPRIL